MTPRELREKDPPKAERYKRIKTGKESAAE